MDGFVAREDARLARPLAALMVNQATRSRDFGSSRVEPQADAPCADAALSSAERDRLVVDHMPLVASIARGYRHYGVGVDDLIQEGAIGLMRAAKRFDPARGTHFSTYAVWWVKATMRNFIFRNCFIVRAGSSAAHRSLFFQMIRLKAAAGITENGRGRVAPETRSRARLVRETEARLATRDLSLDAPVSPSSGVAIMDVLASNDPDPEQVVAEDEDRLHNKCLIADALGKLSDRDRLIIRSRFLDRHVTLKTLSLELGVSKERVRQLERVALRKLRRSIEAAVQLDPWGKAAARL